MRVQMHCVIHYFAYGSNMSRARLEARVGSVHDHGRARLDDYVHRFSKLGRDGTGKGNIERAPGRSCWGVLYELDAAQLERLIDFEMGYGATTLRVHPVLGDARPCPALSFVAHEIVAELRPKAAYVEFYRQGMVEHGIPESYVQMIASSPVFERGPSRWGSARERASLA